MNIQNTATKTDQATIAYEDLHPDLRNHVRHVDDRMPILHHPLVVGIYLDAMAEHYNAVYTQNRSKLARLESQKEWSKAIWLHERPYRMDAIMLYADDMEPPNYSATLAAVWADTEFPFDHTSDWLDLFTDPKFIEMYAMTETDFEALRNMPDNLVIYRGCSKDKQEGMAWTTEKETAQWFAARWGLGDNRVYTTTVPRRDVFMFCDSRGESEIVVDPRCIVEIRECEA